MQRGSIFFSPFLPFCKREHHEKNTLDLPYASGTMREGVVIIARFLGWKPLPSEMIRKCQLPQSLPCWYCSGVTHLSSSLATEVSLYHSGVTSLLTPLKLLFPAFSPSSCPPLSPRSPLGITSLSELLLHMLQDGVAAMSHPINTILPDSTQASRIHPTAHFLPVISHLMA